MICSGAAWAVDMGTGTGSNGARADSESCHGKGLVLVVDPTNVGKVAKSQINEVAFELLPRDYLRRPPTSLARGRVAAYNSNTCSGAIPAMKQSCSYPPSAQSSFQGAHTLHQRMPGVPVAVPPVTPPLARALSSFT